MTLTTEQLDAIATKLCVRAGCNYLAVPNRGRKRLCVKHTRFKGMRDTARAKGKYIPTTIELEKLWDASDMICPHCGVGMQERGAVGKAGARTNTVTLQHYADGTIGLICHACNVRDGQLPPGVYFATPPGHRYCCGCKDYLPIGRFTEYHESRRQRTVRAARCKECLYVRQNFLRRDGRRRKKLACVAKLVERM